MRSVEHKPVQFAWRGGASGTANIPGKKGGVVGKHILIEVFYLTAYASRGLSAQAYDALRQALDVPPLHARLLRTVHRVACRHPALSKAQGRLARRAGRPNGRNPGAIAKRPWNFAQQRPPGVQHVLASGGRCP